jgi:hypothetical protein
MASHRDERRTPPDTGTGPADRVDDEKEAAVVQCGGCGNIFAGRIGPEVGIQALGIGNRCCEGHEYRVMEDGSSNGHGDD